MTNNELKREIEFRDYWNDYVPNGWTLKSWNKTASAIIKNQTTGIELHITCDSLDWVRAYASQYATKIINTMKG